MQQQAHSVTLKNRPRGSYILMIHIGDRQFLEIGSLGRVDFVPGWYLYVGSAMSGLTARLCRHFKKNKTPHWHIDYLTNRFPIKTVVLFPSDQRLECLVADRLKEKLTFIPRFGCSDCECDSHLFFLSDESKTKVYLENIMSAVDGESCKLARADIISFLGV